MAWFPPCCSNCLYAVSFSGVVTTVLQQLPVNCVIEWHGSHCAAVAACMLMLCHWVMWLPLCCSNWLYAVSLSDMVTTVLQQLPVCSVIEWRGIHYAGFFLGWSTDVTITFKVSVLFKCINEWSKLVTMCHGYLWVIQSWCQTSWNEFNG